MKGSERNRKKLEEHSWFLNGMGYEEVPGCRQCNQPFFRVKGHLDMHCCDNCKETFLASRVDKRKRSRVNKRFSGVLETGKGSGEYVVFINGKRTCNFRNIKLANKYLVSQIAVLVLDGFPIVRWDWDALSPPSKDTRMFEFPRKTIEYLKLKLGKTNKDIEEMQSHGVKYLLNEGAKNGAYA